MYVDEVGNPDLESSDDPNHRFLSLTGIIIDLMHVQNCVHPEMESLKQRYFGAHPDEPIILHRKEIVNANPPFTALRDVNTRERFDEELLHLLGKWEYTVLTVCLDKMHQRETYTTWRYDPYHYCLTMLLERYVLFLKRQNTKGDVMAESRGGKEDKRLKDSFHRLWDKGTDYMAPATFQQALTSSELKVQPKSANIAGLQLADLIAHPSRSEILQENKCREKPLPPFGEKVIEVLQAKYDKSEGKIYGKKMI
jgi:hypothetical protein